MPDRREFLKGGLAAFGLGWAARRGERNLLPLPGRGQSPPPGDASSPFLHLPAAPPSITTEGLPFAPWFLGDDFPDEISIPFHSSWQGSIPEPEEDVDVAVVGGGISGLATAWLLRRHRPVVFDLRPRFGGNALGEVWRGTKFSLGSAYFITPDPGTFLHRFYHRLGLHQVKRSSFPPDPVELYGQIREDFWSGAGLSTAEQLAFQRYAEVVTFMALHAYPEIPLPADPVAAAFVRDLDQRDFRTDLEARMGMPLTPLLAAGVQGYFYSSFGAPMELISAASGWNFVAAEEFGRWVLPGGNAGMALALWERLRDLEQHGSHGPHGAPPMLRAGCRVVDVRREGARVLVTWVDPTGAARSLRARYVVMAGSKHVCKHVLHGIQTLDPAKYEAMQQIETMAYVVANVLVDAPVQRDFYDLFRIGDETFPMSSNAFEAASRPVDVLNGHFARQANLPRGVLTFYWPLPWFSARFTLLIEDPYHRYAAAAAPHIRSALALLGVPEPAVRQVRLARWGHAMPLARPGLIAAGVPGELLRPFQERVYFVNQDDWALPAIENSLLDARSVSRQIDGLLA